MSCVNYLIVTGMSSFLIWMIFVNELQYFKQYVRLDDIDNDIRASTH